MRPFRNMLMAADFSECSLEAFRVACALADDNLTRMIVLHAIEDVHDADRTIGFDERGIVVPLGDKGTYNRDVLNERLRELYAPNRPIEVVYRIEKGPAAEVIESVSREAHPDLIILGTHGRTGLRRLLTGSVAEAVLRRARCPVLALRTASSPEPLEPIRAILHPTDFSEESQVALAAARELARAHGARLVVIYVAPLIEAIHLDAPVTRVDPITSRKALDDLRARIDGPDLKYPVEVRYEEGEAAPRILQTAGEIGSGLIVLGTHGRSGLGRALMGSVAEDVLRGARCPVLAIKSLISTKESAATASAPATM